MNYASTSVKSKFSNAIDRDETQIRQRTEQWRSLWEINDRPFTGKGLEQIFATGKNQILVPENSNHEQKTLYSLQEYLETWIPEMQNFSCWKINLEDNLAVSFTDNLAVTTFSFTSSGKTREGQKIEARQYGTHTWKYLNGEWRLVHELYTKP